MSKSILIDESIERLAAEVLSIDKEDKKWLIRELLKDDETRLSIKELIAEKLDDFDINVSIEATGYRDALITKLEEEGLGPCFYTPKGLKTGWVRDDADRWIVMPYAEEWRADNWILGIDQKEYDWNSKSREVVAILLCWTKAEKLMKFALPQEILREIIPKLDVSNGQYKIKVRRERERYYITMPDNNQIEVTECTDNRVIFCGNIS